MHSAHCCAHRGARAFRFSNLRRLAVGALCAVLAACGGGGGGGSTAAPPVSGSSCDGVAQISADTNVDAGKTAGAVVLGCQAALVDVTWTQTAGPAVNLVADGTQAVAIESAVPGTVTLRADVRDATGASITRSVSIDVGAPPASSAVTLRGDQAVRSGGKVSIRAWPLLAAGDAVATLRWTQIAGPTVALDNSDTSRILFTAPTVGADTLLKFRVTMTTAFGATDSDDVQVLVENYAAPASGSVFSGRHVSRVHPYQRGGAYAGVLARCVYDAALVYRSSGDNNLCRAGDLPLLAQSAVAGVPTVEQVMERVLVSHDYMGANFEQFLRTQDVNADFRRLLAGVSAVVIGAHVRPSF
ncbi:MAG TPA: hypothetical protein VKI18_09400, partial [Albitalea sp.]|nr:hypothetical protein [Albitalea sp.]